MDIILQGLVQFNYSKMYSTWRCANFKDELHADYNIKCDILNISNVKVSALGIILADKGRINENGPVTIQISVKMTNGGIQDFEAGICYWEIMI